MFFTCSTILNLILLLIIKTTASKSIMQLEIISRCQWHAKQAKLIELMPTPVPYVIIHHSYDPPACYTKYECIRAMQTMQHLHQVTNGWNDIGYSFAIGSDGRIYEGRGWNRIGAHAPGYNNQSIGICLIGDWRIKTPPEQQLEALESLIEFGLEKGWILKGYKVRGHRQVREGTDCPGDALFGVIRTFERFDPFNIKD